VVYNLSQALAHLWVMHHFGRYLNSQSLEHPDGQSVPLSGGS
jgi:hypothetical protein